MEHFIGLLATDYGMIGTALAIGCVAYIKVQRDFDVLKKEVGVIEEEVVKAKIFTQEIRSDIQEIKRGLERINEYLLHK